MVLIFNSICIVLKGKGYTKKNSIDHSGDVSTTHLIENGLYSVPGIKGGINSELHIVNIQQPFLS